MTTITKAHLEAIVDRINAQLGAPREAYFYDGTRYWAQPDAYHLDWAYGQPSLVRMSDADGEVRAIIGRCSKRELAERMHAFLDGIDAAKGA
jgi:hypothetical protein